MGDAYNNSANQWCNAIIGRDIDGRWEAVLENDKLYVRYGCKPSNGILECMITDLLLKDGEDQNHAGHLLEAAAHRGLITNIELKQDSDDIKTIRITFDPTPNKKEAHPGPAVTEVSILPGCKYIKIDYLSYCFPHICDIGTPGGITAGITDPNAGKFAIYGAEEWQKVRLEIDKDELVNHPNEHHRLTKHLYPAYPNPIIDIGWGECPMIYNGWFIMGVYNELNGRGFARLVPADTVPYIKLLWNKGFEFFPCWRSKPRPFTSYLYLVTNGAEEVIEEGKRLVNLMTTK